MDIGDEQRAVTPRRGVVVHIVVARCQHDAPRLTVLLLRGCDKRRCPTPLPLAGEGGRTSARPGEVERSGRRGVEPSDLGIDLSAEARGLFAIRQLFAEIGKHPRCDRDGVRGARELVSSVPNYCPINCVRSLRYFRISSAIAACFPQITANICIKKNRPG